MTILLVLGCMLLNTINEADCAASRVCYTSPEDPPYSTHNLTCNDNKLIRIHDARYGYIKRSDYSQCRCVENDCDNCSGMSKINQKCKCLIKHRDVDFWKVLSECSYQETCSVPVPAQQNHTCKGDIERPASYSEIIYGCEKESDIEDFCGGTGSGNKVLIMYNSSSEETDCQCQVKGIGNETGLVKYTIESVDIRNSSSLGGGNYNLTLVSGNETRTFVNESVPQREKLLKVPSHQLSVMRLTVSENTLQPPQRVWILVRGKGGNHVNVSCSAVQQETEEPSSSSHLDITTRAVTPVSIAVSSVTHIAGGVGGGVLVIAVIALLLINVWRKRKFQKGTDDSKGRQVNPVYDLMEADSYYSVAEDMTKVDVVQDNYTTISVQGDTDKSGQQSYFELETHVKNLSYINVQVPNNERYHHVTMTDKSAPTPSTQDLHNPVTDNTESSEDCYNHFEAVKHKHSKINADYDTSASASQAVKELENQDDYSYDHLGQSTVTAMHVAENDYDTTKPLG